MSSGSYFTIYRKHTSNKVAQDVIDALKNEYVLHNKENSLFRDDKTKEDDFPLLMHASFKASHVIEDSSSNAYYDADGYVHDKLLDFHFGSSFSCLKDKFRLNAYKFNESSTLISKNEAEKMLQAIEYVLGEEYSKKFEQVMDNEYVELFGNGYSLFDDRFSKVHKPIYIDKRSEGFAVHFNDYGLDAEVAESDNDMKFNLKRVRACLFAFLNAEECPWDNEELILEYSAY